jgi:hypothetical protein
MSKPLRRDTRMKRLRWKHIFSSNSSPCKIDRDDVVRIKPYHDPRGSSALHISAMVRLSRRAIAHTASIAFMARSTRCSAPNICSELARPCGARAAAARPAAASRPPQ